jgi:hypothetical protein
MTDKTIHAFIKPLYPDVIGIITEHPVIHLDNLQVLIGVNQTTVALRQPFETVILLQSTVNQPLPVRLALTLPPTDDNGGAVIFDAEKTTLTLTLTPGEVGLVRFPMMIQPPTQPQAALAFGVSVQSKTPQKFRRVRLPGGGPPPPVMTVSSYMLKALGEMIYTTPDWDQAKKTTRLQLEVTPRQDARPVTLPPVTYEPLWTRDTLMETGPWLRQNQFDILKYARPGEDDSLFALVCEALTIRMKRRGVLLHPVEVVAMAKAVTFAVEDVQADPTLNFPVERLRWFRELASLLAAEPDLFSRSFPEVLAGRLLNAALYDAVLVGFRLLEPHMHEELGSAGERRAYADNLLKWLTGKGGASLTYLYMPLVLAGTLVAHRVVPEWGGHAWAFHEKLYAAYDNRARTASADDGVILDLLVDMLNIHGERLTSQGFPRPGTEKMTDSQIKRLSPEKVRKLQQAQAERRAAEGFQPD